MGPQWTWFEEWTDRRIVQSLRQTIACTGVVVVVADAASVVASTTGGIVAALTLQVPTIVVSSLLLHDAMQRRQLLSAYRASDKSVAERKAVMQRSRDHVRGTAVDSAWTRLAWPRGDRPTWRASAREYLAVAVLLATAGFAAGQLYEDGSIALAAAAVLAAMYGVAKASAYLTDVYYHYLMWSSVALRGKGDAGPGSAEGV